MKLSIITVNLNNSTGLLRTIKSVLCQSFHDFEFIIIDGGSSDGSVEKIIEHADKINYWISEPDSGIYDAMNKGIIESKGDYILFLNSGDTLCSPDSLKESLLLSESHDLVFCHYNDQEYSKKNFTFFDFWNQSPFSHQAIFFKSNLFDRFGYYDIDYKIVADWSFILNALVNNSSYRFSKQQLVLTEPGGISNSFKGIEIGKQERLLINQKAYNFFLRDYTELQYFKQSKAHRIVTFLLRILGKGPNLNSLI
jgi:glycosyltransferase involved in cell wall biosynthesis